MNIKDDTLVGSRALSLIRPTSVSDLAAGNNIMRLQSEDKTQPLDYYVQYKRNINGWYEEMTRWGLIEAEQKLLEKYLLATYGVAASQETVMRLSMDPNISNFTVEEANALRKGIAKKKPKVIAEIHELFFTKGKQQGASEQLLRYIWDHQIKMSLGYSFSDLHSVAYSIVAVQQAVLALKFPPLYWNCACLSVNASAVDETDYENLLDEGIIEEMEEEDKNTKSKVDYAKIVSAIDNFKDTISIVPPNINVAKLGFVPNLLDNTIVYGLKGIARVGDEVIQNIMERRPFYSVDDFAYRMTEDGKKLISKDKVVNLIKAGAFDELEGISREDILYNYLASLTPRKSNLNLNNFLMLLRADLVPQELNYHKGIFLFTREVRKKSGGKAKANGTYFIGDSNSSTFRWYVNTIGQPNGSDPNYHINAHQWEELYEREMDKVRGWIKENMDDLIEDLHHIEVAENIEKYASGDKLQWELDSINFYHSGHPLTDLVIPNVELTPLTSIIDSHIEGEFLIKGNSIPRYKVYSIVGTVLVRDKQKHLLTFSTPHGVVKVNIYKQAFAKYDREVAGKNGIEQTSFLSKGNMLVLSGILRDGIFIPKVYKNTGYAAIRRLVWDENNKVLLEDKR